jgi:predicted nuclease of restriction endonuclease-like (RecB) superfamily
MAKKNSRPTDYAQTLEEIKNRVRAAQYEALKVVNQELVKLYWDIGRMIAQKQKAHGWGKSVVETLANDLQNEFPGMSGFSVQNLWYMRQFYLSYAGRPKLQPLVGEISWSKHLLIMGRCKDDLAREFYIRMTQKFGWTKNVLALRIQDQTYEKTLLGQTNFDQTLPESIKNQAKLAVRDEYTFENLSIGMILCRTKKRAVVEYALRESNKPIGVAAYRIIRRLSAELKGKLPEPAQIQRLLEAVELPSENEPLTGKEKV